MWGNRVGRKMVGWGGMGFLWLETVVKGWVSERMSVCLDLYVNKNGCGWNCWQLMNGCLYVSLA